MSYRCISIPARWLSRKQLDEYKPLVKKNLSSQLSGIFLSYFTHIGNFSYSDSVLIDPIHEYLCNSEEEFEQMIAQARLEKIL